MGNAQRAALVLGIVTFSGCYHATINTGLAPSPVAVVERAWAHAWLYGLVPPGALDVGTQCPNGVARVETSLSFMNQVATALTGGIYTPMTLRAVCAV